MPIVEMLILFEVSDHIGAINTVMLVVLTAVIGINVLKSQGWSTFSRAQRRMEAGQLPGQEMVEGLFLAIGGAFLLTPGFITDTLGFLFLIGPSRRALVRWLIRNGKMNVFMAGSSRQFSFHTSDRRPPFEHDIYEGEYKREKPPRSRLEEEDRD